MDYIIHPDRLLGPGFGLWYSCVKCLDKNIKESFIYKIYFSMMGEEWKYPLQALRERRCSNWAGSNIETIYLLFFLEGGTHHQPAIFSGLRNIPYG